VLYFLLAWRRSKSPAAASLAALLVQAGGRSSIRDVPALEGTCMQVKQMNMPPAHATGDTAHANPWM
jgi:hypothetical protein